MIPVPAGRLRMGAVEFYPRKDRSQPGVLHALPSGGSQFADRGLRDHTSRFPLRPLTRTRESALARAQTQCSVGDALHRLPDGAQHGRVVG